MRSQGIVEVSSQLRNRPSMALVCYVSECAAILAEQKGHHVSIIRPSQLLGLAGFLFFVCNPVQCTADQTPIPPAKAIQFEGDLPYTPKPLTLKGYLSAPPKLAAIPPSYSCMTAAEMPNGLTRIGASGWRHGDTSPWRWTVSDRAGSQISVAGALLPIWPSILIGP